MEPSKPKPKPAPTKSSSRLRSSRSHADLNALQRAWSQNRFPCAADQYELVKEIGKGACGTVWLAKCLPLDEEVALKILEADDLKCPLEHIMRETQIMHEMRHPNVMPLYCSFVHKEQLWMVMPYVAGGSLFGIISANYPQGLEEEVVATVALDVLRGLDYMHSHSMIHRDVKAANVLVNTDGRVVLSDFGVTANMLEPRAATPKAGSSSLTLRDISSVADLGQLVPPEPVPTPESVEPLESPFLQHALVSPITFVDGMVSAAVEVPSLRGEGSSAPSPTGEASGSSGFSPSGDHSSGFSPMRGGSSSGLNPKGEGSTGSIPKEGGSGAGEFGSVWAAQKYLARNTFTGTPCFMAPEVMVAANDCQCSSGYNIAADVWSFGIFLEELALGRAPYAHMKLESVILTTLHEDAPTLGTQKTKRKFSEELQDIVAQCLQKDPSQRPTCSQLLKHKFFKKAEDSGYLVKYLLNGNNGTPFKDMLRTVTRTLRSNGTSPKIEKTMNVYATATLSGDVANALALLKRMTRPTARKQKAGLLIPPKELACCHGVAFTIMHKAKGSFGAHFVSGNGFVVARAQKAKARRKTFMHWADDTFRPGLSLLDAGLPRKDSAEEKMAEKDLWTAPSYFNITLCGLGDDFEHEEMEAIILLMDQAAVDVFRAGEGVLEHPRMHDSASSVTGHSRHHAIKAYAINKDSVFDMPLTGGRVCVNTAANARMFGNGAAKPSEILSGAVRSPHEFQVLYKLLSSLSADQEAQPGSSEPVRSKPGAGALCRMEERGSTMLYRMPIWLYDDDE
ncbi:g10500 [Coccomyxa elongata]